jgi:hypothetical protein
MAAAALTKKEVSRVTHQLLRYEMVTRPGRGGIESLRGKGESSQHTVTLPPPSLAYVPYLLFHPDLRKSPLRSSQFASGSGTILRGKLSQPENKLLLTAGPLAGWASQCILCGKQ